MVHLFFMIVAQRTVEPIPLSKPMKHGSKGGPTACPPNYYPPQDYNSQPAIRRYCTHILSPYGSIPFTVWTYTHNGSTLT